MTLDVLVKETCYFVHSSAYHLNDERRRILQGNRGVEIEPVDWWAEEIQTCDVEGALRVYEI